jgi:hypothetical protein
MKPMKPMHCARAWVEVWNKFKLDLVLITVFAYTINDQMSFTRVF